MKIGKEKEEKPGAAFSLRISCRSVLANPQFTIRNPQSAIYNRQSGFTLVELLIAMALFAVLMSGVVLLFVGSLRSAKTAYQQMDAFEKARSALTIVQNDLVMGFTSQQSADLHSFYGTPIGMTFVGLVSSSTGSGNFNVARITYVVYNNVINKGSVIPGTDDAYPYRFPEALESAKLDNNGNPISLPGPSGAMEPQFEQLDAYPYPLLRFVEPGATDLNTFPLCWEVALSGRPRSLAEVRADLSGIPVGQKTMTDDERERFWVASCEIWIRALAGGDADVYDFWTELKHPDMDQPRPVPDRLDPCDPAPPLKVFDPLDYMVTDNILSTYPPNRVTADHNLSADPIGNRQERPFCAMAFFDYDTASSFADKLDPSGSGNKIANVWWNDPRSNAVHTALSDGTPYQWNCLGMPDFGAARWDPRLPETVTMSFWLMFESPYPGAPDFKRHFSLQINIPAAYARPME